MARQKEIQMFQIFKMLFPKLWFCLDGDPNAGSGAPEGQPAPGEGNPTGSSGEPPAASPTDDFVDFEGVKVPASSFEKAAKERYKDAFEAQTNRDKWQAENTRKAQEIKALERDAEAFRRQQAEQKPQPKNTFEAKKQEYVAKKSKAFPEVDQRFWEENFQDIWEASGARAQEITQPEREARAADWEKQFLESHPLVKLGSEQYNKMVEYVTSPELGGRGYDPEDAYGIVFKKELMEQEFSARQKA